MALHSFFWVFKAIERPIGETESQRVVTTQRCPHQTWPFFGGVVCVTRACVTTDAEVDDDASARLHSVCTRSAVNLGCGFSWRTTYCSWRL